MEARSGGQPGRTVRDPGSRVGKPGHRIRRGQSGTQFKKGGRQPQRTAVLRPSFPSIRTKATANRPTEDGAERRDSETDEEIRPTLPEPLPEGATEPVNDFLAQLESALDAEDVPGGAEKKTTAESSSGSE